RTTRSMSSASPSVAIARFTPRVRRAGSPTTTPTGTAQSTPSRSATPKLTWPRLNVDRSSPPDAARDATYAPVPASAYCASESWPVYPVTTTSDRQTVATTIVVVTALTQLTWNPGYPNTESTWFSSIHMTATTTATTGSRTRPVPSRGIRSSTVPRSGRARPRNTSTAMMTTNGTAFDQPGCFRSSGIQSALLVSSASSTPMTTPPSSVSGNEVNPP